MTKENFTPTTLSFEDIIDNSKKYIVPKYQRDYSWSNSDDEWDLLWEDIVSENDSHYVGILVLQENTKEINIIDGQQRLTTISIIILAALYLLSECAEKEKDATKKEKVKEQLKILMDRYIGKKSEDLKYYNKISLNLNNKNFYSDICNIPKHLKLSNIKLTPELKTNEYIYKCLKYYYKKIKDYLIEPTPTNILKFIKDNITQKLIFTSIQVSKNENAYLLFETLNSRSIELTAYDLLKNHLLSKAGEKYEQSMLEDLQVVTNSIGNHDITNFIALDWNSRNTPKIPTKRVYRVISSKISSTEAAFKYADEIKQSALLYKKIKNYDVENKEIKETLKVLSYMPKVKQYYMLLLSLMKNKHYSLGKIIKDILNITIRYNYIAQSQANKQETIYNKIAYKIFNNEYESTDEVIAALNSSDLEVTDEEFISKFSKKQFNNEAIDRYILAKIEESYNPHNKIDYDNETIEHITDKSLEPEYINRIGNQTLLTEEDNSKLSGKSYEQKLEFYQTHSRTIVNTINKQEWDENTVNERSKELAEVANKIFK